ncbi:MAG: hypothetical protein ACWGHO_01990 [Candidatus Moraniibacteriota bacterium]
MENFEELKKDLEVIKKRNKRVEADKAWETSLFRKLSIAFLTYVVIVIFFITVGFAKPFINAIVPTLGFLLSILSISILKKYWVTNIYNK